MKQREFLRWLKAQGVEPRAERYSTLLMAHASQRVPITD